MMFRRLIVVAALLFLLSGHDPANAGTADSWRTCVVPGPDAISDIWIGALPPWCHDGYDEQPQAQIWGSGIAIAHYRQFGPDWLGPEGFYSEDYESPIPAGASHTWSNIYLWAQDYAVPGDTAVIGFGLEFPYPPPGYTAHLVLDYVPESLEWTGQTDFWLDLTQGSVITLPVLEVSDGLQGTRMHLTVYAPVPEPSSLIALAGGLAGLGGMALRRRRR